MLRAFKSSSWEKYKKRYPISWEEKQLRKKQRMMRFKKRLLPGFIFIISSFMVYCFWPEFSKISFSRKDAWSAIVSDRNFIVDFISMIISVISLYFTIRKPSEEKKIT